MPLINLRCVKPCYKKWIFNDIFSGMNILNFKSGFFNTLLESDIVNQWLNLKLHFLHTTSVFAISGDQMITFTVCEQKLSSAVSSIKNFSCLLYQSLNMQVSLVLNNFQLEALTFVWTVLFIFRTFFVF